MLLKDLLAQGADAVGDATQAHMVAIDARAPLYDGGICTRVDAVSLGHGEQTRPALLRISYPQGVRKFINVRDLDIDLIDRINPFEAAYAVLAKTMDEKSLRQIQASIAGKNIKITEDEARELAKRALQFKNERGRVPDINSADAWEKRMAEGVAAFARYRAQAKAAQSTGSQGASGNG